MDLADLVVVNALGILDNPNAEASLASSASLVQGSDELSLDARALADAHASGLTAVTITLGYTLGDLPPYAHTVAEIATWDRLLAEHAADLLHVRTAADIETAHRQGRVGIVYGFQNSDGLEGDPERVAEFAAAGVRVVQLTYNQANAAGGGSMADPAHGLSDFGREVVDRLNTHRVVVDLSHSGEQTCLDAVAASRQPISINHTGCRALVDLPRNKTDAELRLVAESGGFVGIYLMPFLSPTGHATAADVVAHLEHAIDVCGEDHVGIGTDGTVTTYDDLDGYRAKLAEHVAHRQAAGVSAAGERADTVPFVVDLRGVDQFREIARLLEARGHGSRRIEKILGANFVAHVREVWGA